MVTVVPFFRFRYNIKPENKDLFKKLKPPYILIPNHVALMDSVIVNVFLWHRVHFVMSDGNLRNSFMKFIFLKLIAVIPKTKVVSDSSTVRQMIGLARKDRVICVFAEGRASWDGVTHEIYYSTAKLLKVLKIPVVVPLIKGGYLTRPRWSDTFRRGKMVVSYQQLFKGPELANMTVEDIHQQLFQAMQHDDYEFQQKHNIQYKSKRGAEYLERVIIACPVCGKLQSMRSHKNQLLCTACGFENQWTSVGTLKPVNNEYQPERTMTEFCQWQSEYIQNKISEMAQADSQEALFSDADVTLKLGHKLDPLVQYKKGKLCLYLDRFQVVPETGETEVIPLDEIVGAQVLKAQIFEFYRNGTLYHFQFPDKRISGYKYMLAVQKIRPQSEELE